MTHSDVALTRTIRARVPSVPYERIARSILGARYELSLVLCGDSLARRMNREYRKKAYSPNVLSFPLSQREGEIFLNVRKAEREAKQFGTSIRTRLALLFIHGCLHLKGYAHGSKMERAEEKILRKFGIG
ncbi:MAG: rRNA maturation RNase YbeY [Patescibacteria group bacterium]|nr:rRNA maturation RNase YbeY [Patescibacteria group bacterium]